MRETTNIYALSCPDTGLVRYVGKADDPERGYYWTHDPKTFIPKKDARIFKTKTVVYE